MNERQRMQYLEALGVDTFVPRWVLSGARPSGQCSLPVSTDRDVEPVPETPEEQGPLVEQGAQPLRGLVDRLLADKPEPRRAEQVKVHTAAPPKGLTSGVEKAAFSLAFWRVHSSVMVIDSRQPKALPTEALLRSLTFALGLGGNLPAAEVQSWPLPGVTDTGWEAARETIQAFLESRLLSLPVRFLVLMGEDAARAVLPDDQLKSGRLPLDAFACDALLTPSLSDLLLQPSKKASVWHLLAPLRHELNAS